MDIGDQYLDVYNNRIEIVSNLHYTFAIWGFDEVGYTKI